MADLAAKLRTINQLGLARQSDLEEKTGVTQSVISRIMNGRRKTWKPAYDILSQYADMLLLKPDIPDEVRRAALEFLAVGTEGELLASIDLARKLRMAGTR